jgi:hypothetical protein
MKKQEGSVGFYFILYTFAMEYSYLKIEKTLVDVTLVCNFGSIFAF